MGCRTGIEPASTGSQPVLCSNRVTANCGAPSPTRTGDTSFADLGLNQLGERCVMERDIGLKPTSSAWKAEAQPLYHTRIHDCVVWSTDNRTLPFGCPWHISLSLRVLFHAAHNTILVARGRLELP